MKYGIGIDIGGTKISVIVGSERGKILGRREIPTLKNKQVKVCIENLVKHLKDLLRDCEIPKKQFVGVGVCLPGAVNREKGIVPQSPNLPGWKNFPLKKTLTRQFKLPVHMANDANAAALGEKNFGSGKKCDHLIYMTVSTGVGGGIISHGTLLEGSNYVGTEIGHMCIVPEGNLCGCGQRGCLEAYASGTAIAKYVAREIKKGRGRGIQKLLGKKTGITAKEVSMAAKCKNRLALEAFENAGYYLGIGMGSLLNIFNPKMIVLGGGVMKSAPPIHRQAMLQSLKKHSWAEARKSVQITKTKLKDNVGNLGALALAFLK